MPGPNDGFRDEKYRTYASIPGPYDGPREEKYWTYSQSNQALKAEKEHNSSWEYDNKGNLHVWF